MKTTKTKSRGMAIKKPRESTRKKEGARRFAQLFAPSGRALEVVHLILMGMLILVEVAILIL